MSDIIIRDLQRLAASGDNLAARRLRLELKRSGRGVNQKKHLPWYAQSLGGLGYGCGHGTLRGDGWGLGEESEFCDEIYEDEDDFYGDGYGNGSGNRSYCCSDDDRGGDGVGDGYRLAFGFSLNSHLSESSITLKASEL